MILSHRAEQLYILADEEKPTVVWKRLGEETITFSVQEIEETVINTSPQNGGTKVCACFVLVLFMLVRVPLYLCAS